MEKDVERVLLRTGDGGLDFVLRGGLAPGSTYLIEGDPGSGKTHVALQFALEGIREGEPVLYLSLAETVEELRETARSHGWDAEALPIVDLTRTEPVSSLFEPAEVELDDLMTRIKELVEHERPRRIVVDSLVEIRLLAQSHLRYRRELLALKRLLVGHGCAALFLDTLSREVSPRTLVDGTIVLEHLEPEYGTDRRRLHVVKRRAGGYQGGYHDFVIDDAGLRAFPRLVPRQEGPPLEGKILVSGSEPLDTLLGGGIVVGTATLLAGSPGTGKSSVAMLFLNTAADRGDSSAVYAFDERPEVILERSQALYPTFQKHVEEGRIHIAHIRPGEISPGQFIEEIRADVELRGRKIVLIDSLNGYLAAMPNETLLIAQMHDLLTYLGQRGVSTFLVLGQVGIILQTENPINASYLADNFLYLRFFEAKGHVRRAISVIKKRTGSHEGTIRELLISGQGITLGEPLEEFQGVLTGIPSFTGLQGQLLTDSD